MKLKQGKGWEGKEVLPVGDLFAQSASSGEQLNALSSTFYPQKIVETEGNPRRCDET